MSRSAPSTAPQVTGSMRFTGGAAPALAPGDYTISAVQTVSVAPTPATPVDFDFTVSGHRFNLPPSMISSRFPEPRTKGDFGGVMPHIVLHSKTLPWQYTAGQAGVVPSGPTPPVPWLAVVAVPSDGAVVLTEGVVGDLYPASVSDKGTAGTLPAGSISPFGADNPPDTAQSFTDPCSYADFPSDYSAILPTLGDVPLLVHCRETAPVMGDGNAGTHTYSVVVSNSIVQPATDTVVPVTVLLLSIENLEGIQSELGSAPLRLPVLASWTFQSTPGKTGFAALVGDAEPAPLLIAEVVESQTAAAALGLGYTALPHQTRQGGNLVAWYRGPLQPAANPLALAPPYASADALLSYDPLLGMFDLSLAAAWQLGQLLALNNGGFASAFALLRQQTRMAQAATAEMAQRSWGETALPKAVLHDALESALAGGLGRRPAAGGRRAFGKHATTVAIRAARTDTPISPETIDPGLLAQCLTWLTSLSLLEGVPFSYLVPDPRMLPGEALRFFQLDQNWQTALIDGAMSIGRTGGLVADAQFSAFIAEAWGESGTAPGPASGFLLSSEAVRLFPKMQIHGFADSAMTQPLTLLRVEQVAPDVMLALFAGTLAAVRLSPPPEGVFFGFTVAGDGSMSQTYRNLDTGATDPNATMPLGADYCRTVSGVAGLVTLNVQAWATAFLGSIPADDYSTAPAIDAVTFAIEMIDDVTTVVVQVGPA